MKSRGGSGANEEEELLSQKWGLVDTGWWAGREGARMPEPFSCRDQAVTWEAEAGLGLSGGEEEWAGGWERSSQGRDPQYGGVDRALM